MTAQEARMKTDAIVHGRDGYRANAAAQDSRRRAGEYVASLDLLQLVRPRLESLGYFVSGMGTYVSWGPR